MKTEITVRESEFLGEKYYCIAHESGLTICVFPKKRSTAYALFAARYGAADNCFRLQGEERFTEVPDGIAHFLEHKMFENEDGSDAFEQFAAAGANANAYTSHTRTVYLFSALQKCSYIERVLSVHIVRMRNETVVDIQIAKGINPLAHEQNFTRFFCIFKLFCKGKFLIHNS